MSSVTTIDDVISSPGEILFEEFLEPLGISQYRLAKAIGKPQSAISEIVHGQRAITPVTPLVDELAEARLLGRIARAEREYATGQYSDGPSAIASLKEQT